MRIAVAGPSGGDLDRVYDAVRRTQDRHGVCIDLLICCGNFEAVRDEEDLEILNCPPSWRRMRDFHKYHSGEKEAPVLTVFVGGMHESPNMLRELYYGGWVAPKIYYLGYAGVLRCGPLRIAGLSGVFKGGEYFRGHYEFPPYTENTSRSAYAVRDWDVARLEKLADGAPIDIVVTYDWPRGIWKHGNFKSLFGKEELDADMKREMEGGTFGSPAAMELLQKLRPGFWFAGCVGVKFPALVPHKDGTFTRFLNLERCQPGKDFLQVLDVDHKSPSFLRNLPPAGEKRRWTQVRRRDEAPPTLDHDPEWLALQKVNHSGLTFSYKTQKASIRKPDKEEISWVLKKLREEIGSTPRPAGATRRNDMLLRVAQRQGGRELYLHLTTSQLRELYESRGLEFQGHLDKVSLVKQLEEHDEFFAAERQLVQQADKEAFPITSLSSFDRESPARQRRAVLKLLELEDVWAQQEAELRKLQKQDEPDYDPFSETPAPHVVPGSADGDRDDEDSGDEVRAEPGAGAGAVQAKVLHDDGAGDDEDDDIGSLAAGAGAKPVLGDDGGRDDEDDDPDLTAPAADGEEEDAFGAPAEDEELPVPVEELAAPEEDGEDLDFAAVAAEGAGETPDGDVAADAYLLGGAADVSDADGSLAEMDPYAALLAEVEAAELSENEGEEEDGETAEAERPAKVPRLGD